MFVDHAKIHVYAGHGGSGCCSFRREKFVAKGGPDGGDGGRGGSVILECDANLSTLLDFRYRPHYKAERAVHGKGANKHGKNGKDLRIKLPPGTVVRDSESGELLGDLVSLEDSIVVARGGKGGRGNARFVSSTNRAPRDWEQGEFGEERTLDLELKLIADVGLVGLPNAGKSTLISKLSAARPKIADYPFTTLQPNLGIVKYRDYNSFVVADIPGLIEGAHLGKGLGHEFLRHIERTRVLVVLIDITEGELSERYELLEDELRQFNPILPERIRVVALTKADVWQDGDPTTLDIAGVTVCKISSISGEGLQQLKDVIWDNLQNPERGSEGGAA